MTSTASPADVASGVSRHVIPTPTATTVPVVGTDAVFPVRRIYCVGRNYAAHAREMGSDPSREPPFFFCKPADALVIASAGWADVAYPSNTDDYQHEIELVVAIGVAGADIAPADALGHVYGYAVGLDMTRRDRQSEAKQKGHPWELGKAFDASAPISAIRPASAIGHPSAGTIRLEVDGSERQRGDLADMIWPVADVVARLSASFRLVPGDLIYTGTPDGVGRVQRGQRLHGRIDGVGELSVRIV